MTKKMSWELKLELIHSPVYPQALPDHLICKTDDDKAVRAYGIIEGYIQESVNGKTVLDLTDDPFIKHELLKREAIVKADTYDIILAYDTIDHIRTNPVDYLINIKSILNEKGKVFVRCHPYCSRHAGHHYHSNDKAFLHILFSPAELAQLDISGNFCRTDTFPPLEVYSYWFKQAGFNISHQENVTCQLEPVLHQLKSKNYISDKVFKYMSINFMDFVLTHD